MAPAGHSARGWCCWGPQFKEGVALPAWRVWAGPWAESLQGWGRGRGWGRSLCKTGGGAVGTAQPPALSSSRSYLNRGSRASLGGAGTYGCTDPSWQPQDPRPPSSRGRGWLLRPLLACGRVWPSRAQAVLSSPPSQFLGPLAPAALQGSAATAGEGPCVPLSGRPCPIASRGAGLVGPMTSEPNEAHGALSAPLWWGSPCTPVPGSLSAVWGGEVMRPERAAVSSPCVRGVALGAIQPCLALWLQALLSCPHPPRQRPVCAYQGSRRRQSTL